MKSQKALSWLLLYVTSFIILVFFVCLHIAYANSYANKNQPEQYSKSDQHALVAPTVVRVAMSAKGTAKIQPFSINLDTLLAETLTDEYVITEEIDRVFTGTAFSISESGIYATNAHVVSTDYIRVQYAVQAIFAALLNDTDEFIAKYGTDSPEAEERLKKLDELEKLDDEDPVFEGLLRSALTYITYEDEDTKLSIYPQDVVVDSVETLHDSGFEVLNAQPFEEWYMRGKDVALAYVKSEAASPALKLLERNSTTTINTPVVAYGFPGSTDLSLNTFSDVTVTQGTITSIKKPRADGPTSLQTDAKISKGSSGGPLVDEEGKVIGVMSAETGTETGDNFGFALPISLIHELLDEVGFIELDTGYSDLLREGLAYKENKQCELANDKFNEAVNLKENWGVAKKEVQVLINECNAIIASGESIDEVPEQTTSSFEGVNLTTWILILMGGFLIVISTILLMLLLRKNKSQTVQKSNTQTIQPDMSVQPIVDDPVEAIDVAKPADIPSDVKPMSASPTTPMPPPQKIEKPNVSHEDYIENRFSSKKPSTPEEQQSKNSPVGEETGFRSRSPGNEWNIGLTSVTPSDEEDTT